MAAAKVISMDQWESPRNWIKLSFFFFLKTIVAVHFGQLCFASPSALAKSFLKHRRRRLANRWRYAANITPFYQPEALGWLNMQKQMGLVPYIIIDRWLGEVKRIFQSSIQDYNSESRCCRPTLIFVAL